MSVPASPQGGGLHPQASASVCSFFAGRGGFAAHQALLADPRLFGKSKCNRRCDGRIFIKIKQCDRCRASRKLSSHRASNTSLSSTWALATFASSAHFYKYRRRPALLTPCPIRNYTVYYHVNRATMPQIKPNTTGVARLYFKWTPVFGHQRRRRWFYA